MVRSLSNVMHGFIRNNVDKVKSMLKKREINYPLEKLLKLDNEKRKI